MIIEIFTDVNGFLIIQKVFHEIPAYKILNMSIIDNLPKPFLF